ncbi:MAG: HD-GYP domain-containing protein [Bradymonadales bacterium]|nr:HD-GYP domain-containing protein [Bradymonadales bacterium]
MEFVSELAMVATMGGSILFANSKMLEATGYLAAELAKTPVDDLIISPLFRTLLIENSEAAWRELPLFLMSQPIRTREGQTLIGDLAIAPLLYKSKPAVMLLVKPTEGLQEMYQDVATRIQAFGALIEERDPGTASHQRRVSALAMLIGREMGLDRYDLQGIQYAGLVHDIGKMAIPPTILNQPRSLTELEFEVIKKHPQTAYEMLKDIASPWPIAEIVLQHHEREDGSGYPRGLTGDRILLSAKILAVADIVEATASDRPYRPALGLHGALRELRKGYVGRLDEKVVKACHSALKGRSSPVV